MENLDLILPVLSGFIGIFIGGGGVLAVLARANQSKPLKDSTESLLYNAIPIDKLPFLRQIGQAFLEGGQFVAAVTDGKPNEVPPEPTLLDAFKTMVGADTAKG